MRWIVGRLKPLQALTRQFAVVIIAKAVRELDIKCARLFDIAFFFG